MHCSEIRCSKWKSLAFAEQARTLARLEGYLLSERVITLNQEPEVAPAVSVTTGLLPMMAAPIAQGRTFLDSEGQPGQFVAIISDRYWRDTLGAGSVLGSALVIDGQPHTIIGILAPTFAVPFMEAHIFTPLYANPEPQPRGPPRSVQAVAELAPGATVAQVRDELALDQSPARAGLPTHPHRLAARRRSWPATGNTVRCARPC